MKKYSILQRHKSTGSKVWYGRINDDGTISYKSLGTTRKSDATEWLNKMNAEKFLPEEKVSAGFKLSLAKAVIAFLDTVESTKGAQSATYVSYSQRLKTFEKWAVENGISVLGDITKESAYNFSMMLSTKLSPKTHRETMRVVSQFIKFCSDIYEMKDFAPFSSVPLPKLVKRVKNFWTPDQIDKILDKAPSADFRLFWSLMAFAGLRHMEACSIGQQSFKDGKIEIIGKGDKQAFLPISSRLQSELDRHGPVLAGELMAPKFSVGSNSIRYLKRAVEDSGIINVGEITNHRFRHSFASNLIRNGTNVKAVQQLMRHENIQTTLDKYSHLLQEDLTDAVNNVR